MSPADEKVQRVLKAIDMEHQMHFLSNEGNDSWDIFARILDRGRRSPDDDIGQWYSAAPTYLA